MLDADDVNDASQAQLYEPHHPSDQSSSIVPLIQNRTESQGNTIAIESSTSDGSTPAWFRVHPSLIAGHKDVNGRKLQKLHPPVLATDAVVGSSSVSSSIQNRQMRTTEGVSCPAVNDRTWKAVQQLCNIETGPNLLQRLENGARGIGEDACTVSFIAHMYTTLTYFFALSFYCLPRGNEDPTGL